MIREAVILCGGLGTRLQSEVPDLPKAMAPVHGRPFLEYQLDYLEAEGIQHIILATGHLADHLEQHFGAGYGQLRISYSRETSPLGTGGASRLAARRIGSFPFLLLNGDTYFPVPLKELERRHNAARAHVSLGLVYQPDAGRYGGVNVGADGRVTAFSEKGRQLSSLVNAGTYLIEDVLETLFEGRPDPVSLERDGLPLLMDRGVLSGFLFDVPFLDIGVPDDYRRAPIVIPRSRHVRPF